MEISLPQKEPTNKFDRRTAKLQDERERDKEEEL